MTKVELLKEFSLFEDFTTGAQTERAFNYLIEIIREQLVAGNDVALGQNFGEFRVQVQAERSGAVNGVPYKTPAKNVARFRVSAPLKAAIAGNA